MIEDTWYRIKKWGHANAPDMLNDLNPGATDEQLSLIEGKLGIQIPEDFRSSLKVHNGESDGWPSRFFADRGAYLGTDRIVHEWEQRLAIGKTVSLGMENQDPEELIRDGIITVSGPVQPEMFLKEWIPIMECNGDVFWALDLNPVEGGTPGQVIEVDWEGCSWQVIANSFRELLTTYADELESGAYHIQEGLPTKGAGW